jgi:predicted HTH transcriptional regulator
MDISEVTDLHLKTFNTSWDYYIDNHHSVEDNSLDKVRDFIELANKYKDIKITDGPVRLLNKFELIRENKISYGGFLLFMKGASALTTISIVKIFDDRIEIYNPGKLPEGLSVEKLLSGDYISTIRNKKVAEIFKEAKIIEKYGSGILRILEGFAAHGLQAPKFEEIGIGFRVTAFKETAKNDRIKDRLNDRIKEKTLRYNEKVAVKTEEKERILMQKIRENPLITAEELSGILNIKTPGGTWLN